TPCPASFFTLHRAAPISTLFPYTTLFRSNCGRPLPKSSQKPRNTVPKVRNCAKNLMASAPLRPALPARPALLRRVQHLRRRAGRSEEHTSELQSPYDLVCRLLLEKKNHKY